MDPLVSVVMPMRNAEPFVRQALQSVLCETAVALEVVVVDDGSIDGSRREVDALADPRVRLVPGPQRGIAACLNTGFEAARGRIIMRCDADDLFPSGRIGNQLAWLEAHPDYIAVCGGFNTIDRQGRPVSQMSTSGLSESEDIDAELCCGVTRTSLCTYALRKSSLARIGLFREYFETSEDLDYQFRVGEAGRVRYLPSSAYFYRLHSSSVTHTQRDGRRAFFEDMARRFLEQRRSDGTDALMKGAPPAPPSPLHGGAPSLGRHLHEMLMGQAWRDLESGRAQIAISNAWRAVASDLSSASVWKDAVVLTLKATLTRRRDPER